MSVSLNVRLLYGFHDPKEVLRGANLSSSWRYEDVEAAGGDAGSILHYQPLGRTILDDLDGYRTPAGPLLTIPDVSASDRATAETCRASLIAQGLPDPGEATWFVHLDVC